MSLRGGVDQRGNISHVMMVRDHHQGLSWKKVFLSSSKRQLLRCLDSNLLTLKDTLSTQRSILSILVIF